MTLTLALPLTLIQIVKKLLRNCIPNILEEPLTFYPHCLNQMRKKELLLNCPEFSFYKHQFENGKKTGK